MARIRNGVDMSTRTLGKLSDEGLRRYRFSKTGEGTSIVASSISWESATMRSEGITGQSLVESGLSDEVEEGRLRVNLTH